MSYQGSSGGGTRMIGGQDNGAPRRLPMVLPAADRPARGPSEDDALRDAVARAHAIAGEYQEPFRSLAFTALLDRLLAGGGRGGFEESPDPAAETALAAPPDTGVQIAEFLAAVRADSHPNRVAAIAYYHHKRQPNRGVTTRDLQDAYQRARAKRPQNFPDVIASCVRRGYLVEGAKRDGMKSWVITRSGEQHVEQGG